MSNDTTRAMNRAAMVAAATKYLGPEREKHCELLGEIMTRGIQAIAAAAGVKIKPAGDTPADVEQIARLGPQIQQHAEQIAHTAIQVLTNVYTTTLIVASGVPIDDNLPSVN